MKKLDKTEKKRRKKGMYFAAAIAALLTICGMFGCGGGRKEDVEPYAKNVSALEIPAGVRIAALGEASHGGFRRLCDCKRLYCRKCRYGGGCGTKSRISDLPHR